MECTGELEPGLGANQREAGVILEISGSTAKVMIVSPEGCSLCAIKGACSSSSSDRVIQVPLGRGEHFLQGQSVWVCRKEGMGLQAAVLVFLMPVVLMGSGIALAWKAGWTEVQGALLGFAILLVYFGIFALFRKRLEGHFTLALSHRQTQEDPTSHETANP